MCLVILRTRLSITVKFSTNFIKKKTCLLRFNCSIHLFQYTSSSIFIISRCTLKVYYEHVFFSTGSFRHLKFCINDLNCEHIIARSALQKNCSQLIQTDFVIQNFNILNFQKLNPIFLLRLTRIKLLLLQQNK